MVWIIYTDPCIQNLSIRLPLNEKQAIAGRQRQMISVEFDASMVYRVPGQSALHRETVSKNQNQKPKPNPRGKQKTHETVFLGYYQGTHKVQLCNEIIKMYFYH